MPLFFTAGSKLSDNNLCNDSKDLRVHKTVRNSLKLLSALSNRTGNGDGESTETAHSRNKRKYCFIDHGLKMGGVKITSAESIHRCERIQTLSENWFG